MVDGIKKITSLNSLANDQLRKNFKNISSQNYSKESASAAAINNLSDTIKVSVDAIRSLARANGSNIDQNSKKAEVALENSDSAYATPNDLQKVQESAEKTGTYIQFNSSLAMRAHGEELDSDSVAHLLAD